ncbi:FAD-binding oxidoreductase [Agromyces sp. NPDC058110]|uniref:FAD-binding oxidoreductase n=1 Tax=Agromyces sp. NPDC058110 TaxID=3346345 RepID=UPI0036D9D650
MSILSTLSDALPGSTFGPDTPEYDAGRTVFLGPGTPAAVVRPASADEVAEAVRTAVRLGVAIHVRSGGHGSEPAADGIVIDLSALCSVGLRDGDLVDVGGGAHWSDVADALAPHALAVTSGDTRDVGVGGIGVGGGIGWLVRTHGLAIDLLTEVELVTAAGAVVTANERSHPDLFWAVRGGGGNFGIVTRFTFRAVPVDGLVGGHVRFDESDVPAVLRAWRDITLASPDELNSTLLIMPPFGPDMPGGPQLGVALRGTEAELRGLLAPLLELPSVTDVSLAPLDYGDLLEAAPPGKPPFRFVGGNGFVPELDDAFLDACVHALGAAAPTMLMLRALGGAFGRVAPDATPIAFRDAEAFLVVNGVLDPGVDEATVADLQLEVGAPLDRTSGRYANFTQEYGDGVLATIYPPAVLARLRSIKAQVDPGDVFRPAHHIAPA